MFGFNKKNEEPMIPLSALGGLLAIMHKDAKREAMEYIDQFTKPIGTDKTCTKCGKKKPLDEFNKHNRSKDGKQSWCRACQASPRRRYGPRKTLDPDEKQEVMDLLDRGYAQGKIAEKFGCSASQISRIWCNAKKGRK